MKHPRLAVRALIVEEDRLLLVNAYPDRKSDLWCAPGGGVEAHASLPENLMREVFEETGLTISVGGLAGVNEFHAPDGSFHQIDLYFRASVARGVIDETWRDPEGVVNRWRWTDRAALATLRHKPDSLASMAFGDGSALYDPLEPIVV
ncbi:MAG: NUDIX domain-containing protein [Rubricella sp.]